MIRKVWIEEGCISCNLCEDLAAEVFEVPAGSESKLRKGWEKRLREEGVEEKVVEAEESCPVEVIRTERDPG